MKLESENLIKIAVANWIIFIIVMIVVRTGNTAVGGNVDLTDNSNMATLQENIFSDSMTYLKRSGLLGNDATALDENSVSKMNDTIGVNPQSGMKEAENSQQFDAFEGIFNIGRAVGQLFLWMTLSQIPLLSLQQTLVFPVHNMLMKMVMFLFLVVWQLVILYYFMQFIFGYRLKN